MRMFNLSELIEDIISKYDNKNILQDLVPRVYLMEEKT